MNILTFEDVYEKVIINFVELNILPGPSEVYLHLQILDIEDMKFGTTHGEVRPYYTWEIIFSGTKLHIYTTKIHNHHPKVEGRDGLQVDLGILWLWLIK